MFCSPGATVLPTHLKQPNELKKGIDAFLRNVKDKCFDGKGEPIEQNGKVLIATIADLEDAVKCARARIKNCAPPTGRRAWVSTGWEDANHLTVWAALFHTCHNEKWHAFYKAVGTSSCHYGKVL